MMIGAITSISSYADIFTFVIGLPTVLATYYQAFKTRQEARREREGMLHSQDCLEFVSLERGLHQPGAAGDASTHCREPAM